MRAWSYSAPRPQADRSSVLLLASAACVIGPTTCRLGCWRAARCLCRWRTACGSFGRLMLRYDCGAIVERLSDGWLLGRCGRLVIGHGATPCVIVNSSSACRLIQRDAAAAKKTQLVRVYRITLRDNAGE